MVSKGEAKAVNMANALDIESSKLTESTKLTDYQVVVLEQQYGSFDRIPPSLSSISSEVCNTMQG